MMTRVQFSFSLARASFIVSGFLLSSAAGQKSKTAQKLKARAVVLAMLTLTFFR